MPPNDTVKGALAVFLKSSENFVAALSPAEQKLFRKYQNPTSMIQSLRKQCADHAINQAPLMRCCVRMDKIRIRMEPFFDIIGIFCQSNADIACLVWGSLRLLFHLGQNYATFLEKIYTMFDDMVEVLPAYEEYVDHVQSKYAKGGIEFAPRLLKALAYVYSDILDFCLGAVRILSPRKGACAKAKLVWGIGWKPFDVRFRDILKRFDAHTKALDREIGSTSFKIMGQHYEKIEHEIRKAQNDKTVYDTRQMMLNRASELREWIGAGDWESIYTDISDRRAAGSCDWLQYDPVYVAWKEKRAPKRPGTSEKIGDEDILLVNGKPGYGKTFLCASLIEHSRRRRELSVSTTDPLATFYFFNGLGHDLKTDHPDTAFRAVLAQLLHAHELEEEAIDALSLMKHNIGRGQLVASLDEVLPLLQWFLDRYPNTTMFFDGVDECSDERTFFRSLHKVLDQNMPTSPHVSRPGVVLFARPTLLMPPWVTKRLCSIHLNSSQNLVDIQAYLRVKIMELEEDGLLGDTAEIATMTSNACKYANGMFLWARLLIEYLSADGLSVNDRWEALNNLVRFEGLDQLYSLILRNLAKKLPQKSKSNLKATFQWIAGAIRPLHIDELPHAIVSTSEAVWSERDVIPNLKQTLTRMSGALLELGPDLIVRFTHMSAVEFLKGTHLDQYTRGEEREFSLHTSSIQQLLASACLKYISQSVPATPLSGSSQITPIMHVQNKLFPFAKYSLTHWVAHVNLAIKERSRIGLQFDSFCSQLLHLLYEFIHSKKQIMVWIELAWLFGHPASLGNIPALAKVLLTNPRLKDVKYVELPGHLYCLDVDLKTLEKRWGTVLSRTPNEIWEPSIPAFTKSDYYLMTEEAKLTTLESVVNQNEKSVTIQSQVSVDGKEIAIVRLSIPRSILGNSSPMCIEDWLQQHTSNWKAVYEVWNLSTKQLEFRFFVPIPAAHAKYILKQQAQFCNDYLYRFSKPLALDRLDFEFPVSFSSNLRVALILGSFVKIKCRYQEDNVSYQHRYTMSFTELNPWIDLNWPKPHEPQPMVPSSFAACLSPSGQAILVARPSNYNGHVDVLTMELRKWDLLLYHAINDYRPGNLDKSIAKLEVDRFDLAINYQDLQDINKHFLFHPLLPVLVFCFKKKTVAWSYSEPGARMVEVYADPLRKLNMSSCGQHLQGFSGKAPNENLVVLDISSILCHMLNLVPIRVLEQGTSTHTDIFEPRSHISSELVTKSGTSSSSAITLQSLARSKSIPSPTSTTSTVNFATNAAGVAEMSMLRHFGQEGAVVLHTLSEKGIATSETITRLPEDLMKRAEPVLIRRKDGGEEGGEEARVTLVLNQRPKATYNFRESEIRLPTGYLCLCDQIAASKENEWDGKEEFLPIVLERTVKSIPVTVVKIGRLIPGDVEERGVGVAL